MLYFVVGKGSVKQDIPWHVGEVIPRISKVKSIYADGHELEWLQELGYGVDTSKYVILAEERANGALRAMRLAASTHHPVIQAPEETTNATQHPCKFGLGDVVSFGWKDGWDQATVNFVHPDGTVDLFRPYVQTADFSYTGGVICYVGIDTNNKRVDPSKLKLLRKGKPLR